MSFQESKSRMPWRAVLVGVALTGASCEPVAEGDVRVTMSGGDGTQRGYPSHLFQDGWSVDPEEFTDVIGRNFKEPREGLGFDGSPTAHMWRTMIWPNNFL